MFRFFLIFLLILLVVRFLNRLFFSSSYVHTNERQPNDSQKSRKEGSVTLEKNPKSEKLFNKEDGEYVDYEEVK